MWNSVYFKDNSVTFPAPPTILCFKGTQNSKNSFCMTSVIKMLRKSRKKYVFGKALRGWLFATSSLKFVVDLFRTVLHRFELVQHLISHLFKMDCHGLCRIRWNLLNLQPIDPPPNLCHLEEFRNSELLLFAICRCVFFNNFSYHHPAV